jgi:hypothetical protein
VQHGGHGSEVICGDNRNAQVGRQMLQQTDISIQTAGRAVDSDDRKILPFLQPQKLGLRRLYDDARPDRRRYVFDFFVDAA